MDGGRGPPNNGASLMDQHNARRPHGSFCGRTRREFLWEIGGGFGSVALTALLGSDGFLARQAIAADGVTPFKSPLAPKAPPLPAKAKSVIFLFMYGGPSHIDTFDFKPNLYPLDGKTIAVKTFGRGGKKNEGRIVGPKWSFRRYGERGKWVSELFPDLATCVDDIAFIHSMYAESPIHGSAMLMMNSGRVLSGNPCLGTWVNYGLGSENENLPGFVVMLDKTGGPISGSKNWSSGYMPAAYPATVLRSAGVAIPDLASPASSDRTTRRLLLDRLRQKNETHLAPRADNSELAARIASYELAFKMQQAAPEAVDFGRESPETLALYGMDQPRTADFGRKCLIARRLVERGVRFVQLYSGGAHNDDNWDAHADLVANHTYHAGRTDKPIAGLLRDLKRRGLLDETLVVWGGEFGRMPMSESGRGRDHNPHGFTTWLAGAGIKGGTIHGATDAVGLRAEADPVHVHDLHATILHLMGIDHTR